MISPIPQNYDDFHDTNTENIQNERDRIYNKDLTAHARGIKTIRVHSFPQAEKARRGPAINKTAERKARSPQPYLFLLIHVNILLTITRLFTGNLIICYILARFLLNLRMFCQNEFTNPEK